MTYSAVETRHHTIGVKVGHIQVGGGAPIVVQSMTNTDTADVEGTAKQVAELARAGSELVRITVDREESAAAVAAIADKLAQMKVDVPLQIVFAKRPGIFGALVDDVLQGLESEISSLS